jgi:hypothetical protein
MGDAVFEEGLQELVDCYEIDRSDYRTMWRLFDQYRVSDT